MELSRTQTRLKEVASDLSEEDLEILNAFAKMIKRIGKARDRKTIPSNLAVAQSSATKAKSEAEC